MSSLNTYNLNMLNECLKKVHYTNQAKVRSDMLEAMNKLQTLQPRVGFINFTNGTKKQLLCIYGTIPMMHNGNKYNIPMNFWIPEMYPQSAPLTFVDPTENMMIKEKHKHVDSQGRCYSPYLSRWTPVSCNFLGLINDLSEIFNGDPPVFQKPASTTPPPSSTSTPYNNRMYTQPQPQQQPQPPSTQYTPSPTPSSNYPYQQPPPVSYATTTLNGTNNNNSHTTTTSPIPTTTSPSPTTTTIQNNEKNQLIQKVRTSCATVVQELQERIDSDMQVFSKLTSRANELTAQEMKLGIDENSNTTNTTTNTTISPFHLLQQERNVLSEREQSLNKWIDSHEHKELDVDKMIEPEDMHSRQILELLAEENSIDDLVWILGEALHKGNMDCDTYLTRVRQLGREQFMKKALLLKLSYKL